MNHSPAKIIAELLIGSGAPFTDPEGGLLWPLFVSSMPDGDNVEDDCGAIYDTTGMHDGRLLSGENLVRYGIQVRVRANTYATGWQKGTEVDDLFELVHNRVVTIDGHSYTIESIAQTSPVIALGAEQGTGRRSLFTLNALVRLEGD
jgi:hypothetical protein